MADVPLRPDAFPAEDWRRIHEVADRQAAAVAAALAAAFAAVVALADWAEVEAGLAYHDVLRVLAGLRLYRLEGELTRRVQPALDTVAADAVGVAVPMLAEQMAAAQEPDDPDGLREAGRRARERTRALLWLPFAAYMTSHSVSMLRWLIEKLFPMPGSPADKASILKAAVGLNRAQARTLVRRMEAMTTDGTPWRRVVLVARRQAGTQAAARARQAGTDQAFRWATRAEVELFRGAGLSNAWQLEWLAILDARTCPVCLGLDGSRVAVQRGFHSERAARSAEYDFNGSVGLPPIHNQCRCRVVLLYRGAFVRQVAPG